MELKISSRLSVTYWLIAIRKLFRLQSPFILSVN